MEILKLNNDEIILDLEAIKTTTDYFTEVLNSREFSDSEICEVIKSIADENLAITKKKYMNTVLRNKLSTIESFIKQRDIKVDSIENHNAYIDALFNGENWNRVKNDLKNVFNSMEENYSAEQWEQNWLDLLDGKIVYRKTIRSFAQSIGINDNNFEKQLIENITSNKNSEFMKLINRILSMFD